MLLNCFSDIADDFVLKKEKCEGSYVASRAWDEFELFIIITMRNRLKLTVIM